jgi:hypothetical protein
MEINLDELLIIHSALVNVKIVLSQERKMKPMDLKALVDDAYQVVMNKIDSLDQNKYRFEL